MIDVIINLKLNEYVILYEVRNNINLISYGKSSHLNNKENLASWIIITLNFYKHLQTLEIYFDCFI